MFHVSLRITEPKGSEDQLVLQVTNAKKGKKAVNCHSLKCEYVWLRFADKINPGNKIAIPAWKC